MEIHAQRNKWCEDWIWHKYTLCDYWYWPPLLFVCVNIVEFENNSSWFVLISFSLHRQMDWLCFRWFMEFMFSEFWLILNFFNSCEKVEMTNWINFQLHEMECLFRFTYWADMQRGWCDMYEGLWNWFVVFSWWCCFISYSLIGTDIEKPLFASSP